MRFRILCSLALLSVSCLGADITLWVDDANGEIGKVDVVTGAVTLVGNSGRILTDIAFDPNGNLFGIDQTNIYRINTTTGAATVVAPLNPAIPTVPSNIGLIPANSLVFSSSGTLYTATNQLYTVNPSTGADTRVGALGDTFISAGDLAFVNGTLFLSDTQDRLLSVDPATGAATLVGNMGVANVFGLATPDNVTLYGVAGTSVYLINPTNGNATLDVNFGGHGLGQAFGESFVSEAAPPTATPEPSSLFLITASLLLLLAGIARKRLPSRNRVTFKRASVNSAAPVCARAWPQPTPADTNAPDQSPRTSSDTRNSHLWNSRQIR